MTTYWCERAWTGIGAIHDLVDGLVVEVDGTHIVACSQQSEAPPGAIRLLGLTVPGFANCHSHAFHRALRGRTQRDRGSFWTWRDTMYAVAARLDPDNYYQLALATYQEMALAGITTVGEFHYLHHQPGGTPYDDPNEMGHAVVSAARDAGLRITLLDTCYLSAGFGAPLAGVQTRFGDGDADGWRSRLESLEQAFNETGDPGCQIGHALHSVRAVPAQQIATVATANAERPLHIHLSEQPAENEQCVAHYGVTPTRLLAERNALDDRTSLVHATHLTPDDVRLIGAAGAYADFCPTTERDLADGIGPSSDLAAAGATLTLGTDSNAVIDMLEEMRAVELNHRLATRQRGTWRAHELLLAATANGHRSLGFASAGRIAEGQWADLVTINMGSIRTACTGGGLEGVIFAANASDVVGVVASGRQLDLDPQDVAVDLATAIAGVTAP